MYWYVGVYFFSFSLREDEEQFLKNYSGLDVSVHHTYTAYITYKSESISQQLSSVILFAIQFKFQTYTYIKY